MPTKPYACDLARLEAFLANSADVEETRWVESHLEVCEACRQRINGIAAEPESWSAAVRFLKDEPDDREFCGSADGEVAESPQPSHDEIERVVETLGPTDDPRMLGRLGTYEIVGVIGAGGMGVVLKGFDATLNRYVAIKVLAPRLASSGAARQRFAREAQAAAAVVHPHVVGIHAVSSDWRFPYLVMPYIRGGSLQGRLDQHGPLATAEILRIGSQTAAGLAAAHAQGLVHRDIKPANILLADGVERVTITDFGLARAEDDASTTGTGVIAGTPQYMSPEQARGEPVDARSDLFSLGSLMNAMCAGRPPFRAENSFGILRKITDTEPRPIREINPDIPAWLESLVGKLLAKPRDERFQTASDVAELLEECLAHWQQPTLHRLPKSVSELVPAVESRSQWFVAFGVVAVGIAFVVALAIWRPGEKPVNEAGSSRQVRPFGETIPQDESAFDTWGNDDAKAIRQLERELEELERSTRTQTNPND